MSDNPNVVAPALTGTSPPHQVARLSTPRRVWPWALAAGLVAGFLAAAAGESFYHRVPLRLVLPADYESMNNYQKSSALADATRAAQGISERVNVSLAYGFLGSVLAAALGLAGGLASRSPRQGLMAAVIGGLAGAAMGAGAAFAMVPVYFQLWNPEANLMVPSLATNTAIFACIGAAGGLALALGIRRPRSVARAILGGVLGALAAAALVELINAGFFPMLRVEEPIPAERVPRMICHLAVALLTAFGASWAFAQHARKSKSTNISVETP